MAKSKPKAKAKPQPQKRGPKPVEVNWDEFNKLCHLQCTLQEIAGWFDCSEDTIERRVKETHGVKFADYYRQKASRGKISLRRQQFQLAEKGNATMLIWLGKQYLGQSDKVAQTIDIEDVEFTDEGQG